MVSPSLICWPRLNLVTLHVVNSRLDIIWINYMWSLGQLWSFQKLRSDQGHISLRNLCVITSCSWHTVNRRQLLYFEAIVPLTALQFSFMHAVRVWHRGTSMKASSRFTVSVLSCLLLRDTYKSDTMHLALRVSIGTLTLLLSGLHPCFVLNLRSGWHQPSLLVFVWIEIPCQEGQLQFSWTAPVNAHTTRCCNTCHIALL